MKTTISTTIGGLTAAEIGRKVTVQSAHSTITGILRDLRAETDWITEGRLGQHPDDWGQVPGRTTVSVAVGEWSASLPLSVSVEVEL